MSIFRTRYRIVRDAYNGYEAQYRYWWLPFYQQIGGTNTRSNVEGSRALIEGHKQAVVEQVQ